MALDYFHEGEFGADVILRLSNLGDLTGATVYYLAAKKPGDATETRLPAAGNATLAETDTAIQRAWEDGDLDTTGDWKVHAHWTDSAGGEHISKLETFRVKAKWED